MDAELLGAGEVRVSEGGSAELRLHLHKGGVAINGGEPIAPNEAIDFPGVLACVNR